MKVEGKTEMTNHKAITIETSNGSSFEIIECESGCLLVKDKAGHISISPGHGEAVYVSSKKKN
jgi:hypothetical protein